jgi:hypothetical protein
LRKVPRIPTPLNSCREPKLGLFIGSVGIEPDIKNGHGTVNLNESTTAGPHPTLHTPSRTNSITQLDEPFR